MRMKLQTFLLVVLGLALSSGAAAQNRFIKHEVFAMDSFQTLRLDLFDAYEPIVWDGNTVMVKTEIRLYNGSEGILEHFLEAGRYGIKGDSVGTVLTIQSVDKKRQTIRTAKGECYEAIDVSVYIPDTFIKTEDHVWIKKEETNEH